MPNIKPVSDLRNKRIAGGQNCRNLSPIVRKSVAKRQKNSIIKEMGVMYAEW